MTRRAIRRACTVGGADGIRALGWRNERTGRQALRASMECMLAEARDGWFGR